MKKQYYKYRALLSQRSATTRVAHPNTESIFTKAELWYDAPANFNDPFDCNLRTHIDNSTDAEWEAYCDKMMIQFPDSKAQFLATKSGKLWKNNPALGADVGKSQQKLHYNDSSVLCLSKKGNSIPMFSYYADSHCGIAIEFSFSDQEVPCGYPCQPSTPCGKPYDGKVVFRDVEYPSSFPELNFHRLRNTDKIVRHLMFTKSPEWSHEEEFRIFRRKMPKSATAFDRTLLTRVIFGCKTEPADIALVKSWLSGWPSDVVLSKAEPEVDRFELTVTDFDVVKAP